MSENSEILSINLYDQVLLEILTCKHNRYFRLFCRFLQFNPYALLFYNIYIYIYIIYFKYERGDPELSYEWSKKFLA